jgi:two-component system chemotaxis response regulator CheB
LEELRLIVVGASAGGVEAMKRLASLLPGDLPAAVLLVIHFPTSAASRLPVILERSGPLPATHAIDGEPLRAGHIFVAPPDHHLLVRRGHVLLLRGPKENGVRPAVDPLFRSAARAYGPAVVGVLLSGTLDDGSMGFLSIREHGGRTVVQDPEEAGYPGMPLSALEQDAADHVCRLSDMAPLLTRLVTEPQPGSLWPAWDRPDPISAD